MEVFRGLVCDIRRRENNMAEPRKIAREVLQQINKARGPKISPAGAFEHGEIKMFDRQNFFELLNFDSLEKYANDTAQQFESWLVEAHQEP